MGSLNHIELTSFGICVSKSWFGVSGELISSTHSAPGKQINSEGVHTPLHSSHVSSLDIIFLVLAAKRKRTKDLLALKHQIEIRFALMNSRERVNHHQASHHLWQQDRSLLQYQHYESPHHTILFLHLLQTN